MRFAFSTTVVDLHFDIVLLGGVLGLMGGVAHVSTGCVKLGAGDVEKAQQYILFAGVLTMTFVEKMLHTRSTSASFRSIASSCSRFSAA